MAKPPSSAIGIDVGRRTIKAVLLQRRGANRVAFANYAVQEIPEGATGLDHLADQLKALMQELGGSAKAFGIAVSNVESLVRIIEQNTIPPELLRDALRINGPMLLSQDCREWVIDCAAIHSSDVIANATAAQAHYLVGGMQRTHVQSIHEACLKNKLPPTVLQLPPVALLNAFEFANPEIFHQRAFLLVDIGHLSSTVLVGVKGELFLVRTVEYGGSHLLEALILHGAASIEETINMLRDEEVLTVEIARQSLMEVVRSISSSIGYVEARREEPLPEVYVSGGLAKVDTVLKILTEELSLPCTVWDPFVNCELGLPRAKIAEFTKQRPVLGVACGIATEILKGS